jgi:hypothetical protein
VSRFLSKTSEEHPIVEIEVGFAKKKAKLLCLRSEMTRQKDPKCFKMSEGQGFKRWLDEKTKGTNDRFFSDDFDDFCFPFFSLFLAAT